MTPLAGLLASVFALAPAPGDDAGPSAATFAALGDVAAQDLVILGEGRPLLVRLRVMIGDKAFRVAWDESIRVTHAQLDRDGDGRLTVEEAETGLPPAPVAPAGSTPATRARPSVDVDPKDGVVSVGELAEALRATAGPLRVRVDRVAGRRTDALFDHLDRDKDGGLSRPELAAIVGSLRRLDRDDNELIGEEEVDLPGAALADPTTGRPARDLDVPPVAEIIAGESTLRIVRLLIKAYDRGSSRGPGRPDAKLSPGEFAVPAGAFAEADGDRDGNLNSGELREYLARAPRDAIVDVALSADASGRVGIWVRGGDGGRPSGVAVRPLGEGAVELEVGPLRLDLRVDDGAGAADAARRAFRSRFDAADDNADGYLEASELTGAGGQPSPLSPLFPSLDRDRDGKLTPREIDDYVTRQAIEARGRLTLTASNEGRALFGLLDTDRDRRIGAREVLDTFGRVSACDRDRDGRVSPEEIPHHIRLRLDRGDLSALLTPAANTPVQAAPGMGIAPPLARPAVGPPWFRRMDRNRDGDVSRREFLGTRAQFDRLDRDRDGLLDRDEAEAAARPVNVKAPGG